MTKIYPHHRVRPDLYTALESAGPSDDRAGWEDLRIHPDGSCLADDLVQETDLGSLCTVNKGKYKGWVNHLR